MKHVKRMLAAAVVSLSVGTSYAADTELTPEQQLSYSLGVVLGKNLKRDMPNVDLALFNQALSDLFSGNPLNLSEDQINQVVSAYAQARQQEQRQQQIERLNKLAAEGEIKGKAYRSQYAKKPGVISTASGLMYEIVEAGSGPKPNPSDTVDVKYRGSLIDNTVFDATKDSPVSFRVDQVIAGWTEALQLMQVGAKWRLVIPPELGYGPGGAGKIGPNQTLIFDVELVAVK